MLKPFFLRQNAAEVDTQWRRKMLLASEILGQAASRHMRPEAPGDRTRLDLMWNGDPAHRALGIRGPSAAAGTLDGGEGDFEFVALMAQADGSRPDSASDVILECIEQFNADPPPLNLAQVRFRDGFAGERGIWIDTSNENIKALLEEREWLSRALDRDWIVELGQKHKEVVRAMDGELRLVAAVARCWLPSFDVNNEAIPLLSYISIFSQPGPEVNRALLAAGFDLLDDANVQSCSWIEWGAGYGNLSAAYRTRLGARGASSEFDPAAAELLAQNAERFFPEIQTSRAAAERSTPQQAYDLWLIDPPRPGFGALLQTLPTLRDKPRWVLAYHCAAKGLVADSKYLRNAGYTLEQWSSVDAFPATPHLEVLSLWKRDVE